MRASPCGRAGVPEVGVVAKAGEGGVSEGWEWAQLPGLFAVRFLRGRVGVQPCFSCADLPFLRVDSGEPVQK